MISVAMQFSYTAPVKCFVVDWFVILQSVGYPNTLNYKTDGMKDHMKAFDLSWTL